PGGSLSQLLRSKWGPLKDNEPTISFYTRQILEGLKYLHDQKIVHRDIKGDNVLVNTYTGILKISDFGTSKRLAGINPHTETFAGTFQYMAPEVIDQGQRGYGAPADIWSLGCTIVEMATGKTPFIELGSGQEIIFKVGFYKEHPQIPPSMSEKAQKFILRCFIPDPFERATASQLLDDIFLDTGSHRKKKPTPSPLTAQKFILRCFIPDPFERATASQLLDDIFLDTGSHRKKKPTPSPLTVSPTRGSLINDFNRSISVPIDPQCKTDRQEGRVTRFSSTGEDGASNLHLNITRRCASPFDSGPHSPAMYSQSSEDAPYARRSSGVLLSPPVEGMSTLGTIGESEQEGFFLLKKDSQRRATLVQVITEDAQAICELWFHLLRQSVQDLVLTQTHLHRILLPGLRDFIPQTKRTHIERAIALLKEELDFDGAAINQIQLALLSFQEAVNLVLRNHSIKPHWMFALDSLIRSAVQAAITVLSPELGENIAGGELRDEVEEPVNDMEQDRESTSGVSTINSAKSVVLRPVINVIPSEDQLIHQLQQKSEQLRSENLRLFQELIETQETLQEMIKSTLNETKVQINLVQQQQQNPSLSPVFSNSSTSTLIPCNKITANNEESIGKFVNEDYTLRDLSSMTRQDLRRLNLKGGVELRIWRAIEDHKSRKQLEVIEED
ncbi:unnamed protein product, partial [Oppiella nova]